MGVRHASSARTTTLDVRGGALFVRDLGEGRPIVVLHGGPDFDHEYLAPELDGLADRFRVVFYDQRGRGRSFTGEGPGDVTIATEIGDLDEVREWTGAATIALLGHSWGGLLAMEYAIRHPERLSHLILLNTAPSSHQDLLVLRDELRARRGPEGAARMAELSSDPVFQSGDLDAEAEYCRIHFGSTVPPDRLDEIVGRFRIARTPEVVVASRAIEDALYNETWVREDYDLVPALLALRVPTLVIRGENDFIPADGVRRIASAIPDSRFVEIPGVGHFTFLEVPERVRILIEEFLATS